MQALACPPACQRRRSREEEAKKAAARGQGSRGQKVAEGKEGGRQADRQTGPRQGSRLTPPRPEISSPAARPEAEAVIRRRAANDRPCCFFPADCARYLGRLPSRYSVHASQPVPASPLMPPGGLRRMSRCVCARTLADTNGPVLLQPWGIFVETLSSCM